MLDKLEKVKIFIIGLFLIFHIIAYYLTKGGSLFKEDLKITCGKADIMTFLMWLQKKTYIRNLFYYRIGPRFTFFFQWLLPVDRTLHLYNNCPIGKRCHLEHSQNTFLNAKCIGEDFYCLHNVTVGNNVYVGRNPRIGNNVKIFTGAVVIGDIRVGNNVIIAANAVVNKDVPDNCMVGGIPAKIIKML